MNEKEKTIRVVDEIDCRTWKQKLKDGFRNAVEFVEEHPIGTIIVASMGVKVLTMGINGMIKVVGARAEAKQLNTMYDHSLNTRWQLKRPLTNEENVILEQRKAAGEKTGDILESMKVLR